MKTRKNSQLALMSALSGLNSGAGWIIQLICNIRHMQIEFYQYFRCLMEVDISNQN